MILKEQSQRNMDFRTFSYYYESYMLFSALTLFIMDTACILANSEDPGHFIRVCRDSNSLFYTNFDRQTLKIQNGQIHAYCINMYATIHQNETD